MQNNEHEGKKRSVNIQCEKVEASDGREGWRGVNGGETC